jgi:hypothetical protein
MIHRLTFWSLAYSGMSTAGGEPMAKPARGPIFWFNHAPFMIRQRRCSEKVHIEALKALNAVQPDSFKAGQIGG